MESNFEERIKHQFDCYCRKILIRTASNCKKEIARRKKRETLFSDLTKAEQEQLFTFDSYDTDIQHFNACGFDIEIKDVLLAEALKTLTERKREVILLTFFSDLTDEEIATRLNSVRSTVYRNRKSSLDELKTHMEDIKND